MVEYKSQVIRYNIIRSNRKTIAISVHATKEVIVRAPRHISDEQIESLVKAKADWIIAKISEMPITNELTKEKRYKDGDKILYRGKEYTLRVLKQTFIRKSKVILEAEEIIVIRKVKENKETKALLMEWYKSRAKELVMERISYYHPIINKPIGEVRIKSQKRRWGSCSSRGNLNFNWRIILMPDEMFDYIIVHEMCHLLFLNHSKSYWNSVAAVLPDYKEREKWIKTNTLRLEF
jgi:predicted metal-dependent hydrolase